MLLSRICTYHDNLAHCVVVGVVGRHKGVKLESGAASSSKTIKPYRSPICFDVRALALLCGNTTISLKLDLVSIWGWPLMEGKVTKIPPRADVVSHLQSRVVRILVFDMSTPLQYEVTLGTLSSTNQLSIHKKNIYLYTQGYTYIW